ncbi:MAG TPA: hypothetical protein VM934_15920 [Pyrinomonadaceae bacterium]|jgi:hypothetical protein|nr:hypothetical protein [Pyrinomonadaceae bacterium]
MIIGEHDGSPAKVRQQDTEPFHGSYTDAQTTVENMPHEEGDTHDLKERKATMSESKISKNTATKQHEIIVPAGHAHDDKIRKPKAAHEDDKHINRMEHRPSKEKETHMKGKTAPTIIAVVLSMMILTGLGGNVKTKAAGIKSDSIDAIKIAAVKAVDIIKIQSDGIGAVAIDKIEKEIAAGNIIKTKDDVIAADAFGIAKSIKDKAIALDAIKCAKIGNSLDEGSDKKIAAIFIDCADDKSIGIKI